METLKKQVINVNDYQVAFGPDNGLMQVTPCKHGMAMEIYDKMRADHWHENEVDMSLDVQSWNTLSESEKRAYQKALAFLSNLDGMQLHNLQIISQYVTSPWYRMALGRQVFDETLHVHAYSLMIETLPIDSIETYNMFVQDDLLFKKNEYVKNMNQLITGEKNDRNFALATVANQCLEGVMFQTGFLLFYVLAEAKKMPNSAKQIKFINRDEANHTRLFFNMFEDHISEKPYLLDDRLKADAKEMIRLTAEMEKEWGKHIISGGILGLNDNIIDKYVEHLADYFCDGLGFGLIYGEEEVTPNPIPWVEDRMQEFGIETNFFEDKVDAYDTGSLEWD